MESDSGEASAVNNLVQNFTQGQQSGSYLAEDKDENATVAVFDNFGPTPSRAPAHGELTEGVVAEVGGYGEEDIQRYEVGSGDMSQSFEQAVADGDEDALQTLVEDATTGLLDNTTGAMEEILNDENSKISTISQSQSVSPAQVSQALLERALPSEPKPGQPRREPDLEFRSTLAQSLGLQEDVSDQQLSQALADEVNNIFQTSDAIADSKQRYDEVSRQAADAGISHIVSSGNRGEFADTLESRGVEIEDDFYTSVLANDNTTVVGATDDHGTPTLADDTGFEGNSPGAGAEVSAPGTNREMTTLDGRTHTSSGTSYSAPEVAAITAQLQAAHPELTPQQ
ncbi:MAG: S8 family serine peptidase, partial [Candidatus Eremiobacteraeota bacterium]|nr:S8 family serine peptidase [Candidatus Eremiobacteraeota bacterium]